MIRAFHVERILAAAAVLLAMQASTHAAEAPRSLLALAQAGEPADQPKPLLPGASPGALEAPPPTGPAGDPLETETPPPGIEIGELIAIDPDSGGLLEPSMGGLGFDMWEGVPRSKLLRLLPQLPDRYESPALHDLARRLLLSTAIVPPRSEGEAGGGVMAARIQKLQTMGLSGAVTDMLSLVPEDRRHPILLRILVDSRLMAGDAEGACAVRAAAGDRVRGVYWEQLLVVCQAIAGDTDAANFGLNLISETGTLEDPAFFKLTGVLLTGGKTKIRSLPSPSPIHLLLARVTGSALPSNVLETQSLAVLRALVGHPSVSDAVQLEAAERAALAGAIGAARVADRYAAMAFTDKEIAKAITTAEANHTPRNRALLYHAVRLQDLPVGKAAAIQKAWKLAAADGNYQLSAGVYLPVLEDMQPDATLAWFAADAARALYVLDRPKAATEWALTAARLNKEAADKQRSNLLWPLVALAEGSASGYGKAAWLDALKSRAGPDAALRTGLAYSLFEAMGERMGNEDWAALMGGVSRASVLAADPAYLRFFRQAASAGRRGETVLLALLLLGPGGVNEASPQLISEIVVGLRMVLLETEARRLAIEAALQGGL